jgi:hypothetical protein
MERTSASGTLSQNRLAILADALEEAGCDDQEILTHCRSELDHVRGCWVIDLLLGKEDHRLTQAQWAGSAGLERMFRFLWNHRGLSRRKQLLFGVACCRRIWHRLHEEEHRWVVEMAEQLADGFATESDLDEALGPLSRLGSEVAPFAVYYAAYRPVKCAAFAAIRNEWLDDEVDSDPPEQAAQRELLRCLTGTPFRPTPSVAVFLTPGVAATARSIDEQQAFDRLPALADAMTEAGCDDGDILSHCRGGGPHARGCWVVDLILGKE